MHKRQLTNEESMKILSSKRIKILLELMDDTNKVWKISEFDSQSSALPT